ncbi:hypothetical protein D3C81_1408910 [compost metagenome]
MVVHELVQEQDGTLTVRIPETVSRHFSNKQAAEWDSRIGEWEELEGRIEAAADETFACISAGTMPETCKISARLSFATGTRSCGIMLRASEDLDEAYYIRLEPMHNRLVFDMWPRREQGEMQWHIKGDQPHAVELEVPIELQAGTVYNIEIVVENSVCVVYLADQVAMTTRLYNLKTGNWGCFVQEGRAIFEQASISVPN